MPVKQVLTAILIHILFIPGRSVSQPCIYDYFAANFPTPTVQGIEDATFTAQDDLIFTGTVLRKSSIVTDGWLTKTTALGTVLWSKEYSSGFYNDIHFSRVIPVSNNDYLVIGTVGEVDTTVIPPAQLVQQGVLLKMDKYGNIKWTKVFSKEYVSNLSTTMCDVLTAGNGDHIIAINYSGANSSSIILRTDPEGNITWTSTVSYIHSTENGGRFSSLKTTLLQNGDIVVASGISKYDIDNPFGSERQGYYLYSLDFISGSLLWEKAYLYTAPLSAMRPSFGDVAGVSELPNGDISFITSFADTAYFLFRTTREILNFTTDNIGRLKNIKGYSGSKPPLYASSVADGPNGERLILMDNADAPLVFKIDAAGNIRWQESYALTGRSQESKKILNSDNGSYFFSFTHDGGSRDLKLVKTDIDGNADCVESSLALIICDRSPFFQEQSSGAKADPRPAKWYNVSAISVSAYSLSSNIVCKKTCCEDVVMPAQEIDLCNAVSYTLPNGDIIKNSGSYDVVYKTSKGCDSIVIYKVTFSSAPTVSLGPDQCFGNKDSLILRTEPGYAVYYWNDIPSDAPSIIVKTPGQYGVSVTNACGTKKDTLTVFQECEFDIYMPTAFTPNQDGRNDYFRIPSQINNELVSFSIFNRWGQRIFFTKDKSKGWNGMLNEYPAPAGTYVYNIIMKSLDGKKQITKGGWVNLIR